MPKGSSWFNPVKVIPAQMWSNMYTGVRKSRWWVIFRSVHSFMEAAQWKLCLNYSTAHYWLGHWNCPNSDLRFRLKCPINWNCFLPSFSIPLISLVADCKTMPSTDERQSSELLCHVRAFSLLCSASTHRVTNWPHFPSMYSLVLLLQYTSGDYPSPCEAPSNSIFAVLQHFAESKQRVQPCTFQNSSLYFIHKHQWPESIGSHPFPCHWEMMWHASDCELFLSFFILFPLTIIIC